LSDVALNKRARSQVSWRSRILARRGGVLSLKAHFQFSTRSVRGFEDRRIAGMRSLSLSGRAKRKKGVQGVHGVQGDGREGAALPTRSSRAGSHLQSRGSSMSDISRRTWPVPCVRSRGVWAAPTLGLPRPRCALIVHVGLRPILVDCRSHIRLKSGADCTMHACEILAAPRFWAYRPITL
jgi:hypothetical protein